MNLSTDKAIRGSFTFHVTHGVQRENSKAFSGLGVRSNKLVSALYIDLRE